MAHHSLLNIPSWAFVFHFAAWSERKLLPSLVREVPRSPWLATGECSRERVLGPSDSGAPRVSTSWRGLCFAELRVEGKGRSDTVLFGVFWLSGDHTAPFLVSYKGLGHFNPLYWSLLNTGTRLKGSTSSSY